MKLLFRLFIVVAVVAACSRSPKLLNPDDEKNSINTMLDNWHVNAAKANFDEYFAAMDSVSVYIGTDASEVWSKQQFMVFSKPYFDRGEAWTFKPLRRDVYLNETHEFAWFNETIDTWMGICSASGVLQKDSKGWHIKHYLLSAAIPNNVIVDVVAIKSAADSLYLKELQK